MCLGLLADVFHVLFHGLSQPSTSKADGSEAKNATPQPRTDDSWGCQVGEL